MFNPLNIKIMGIKEERKALSRAEKLSAIQSFFNENPSYRSSFLSEMESSPVRRAKLAKNLKRDGKLKMKRSKELLKQARGWKLLSEDQTHESEIFAKDAEKASNHASLARVEAEKMFESAKIYWFMNDVLSVKDRYSEKLKSALILN